jgi:hypothetical protein
MSYGVSYYLVPIWPSFVELILSRISEVIPDAVF